MALPFTITRADMLRSKVVEPGWYATKVTKVSQEPASTDGSTNTIVDMIITQPGAFEGVPLRRYFSEKAPGFAAPFLIAVGCNLGDNGAVVDFERAVGREILTYIKNEMYGDRQTNKAEDFKALPTK